MPEDSEVGKGNVSLLVSLTKNKEVSLNTAAWFMAYIYLRRPSQGILTGYNAVAFKLRDTHLSTIKRESVRHLRNTSDITVLKTILKDFKTHLGKRGN